MIIAQTPFVPHPLEELTQAKVFPSPLPEPAYAKMLEDYAALEGVITQRIVYESDGLKVTGLVTYPAQMRDGAHPVLIYNRGGNKEFGRLTVLSVLRSMAPFTQQGYLVFASNYRGNDGGEGAEEFGGSDVNDVMNLLALARAHPAFDGKNAFMLGHSRGAMMTYIALHHGAPVRAAIGVAGIADLTQAGRERPEIEQHVLERLIPARGDARPAAYAERSALSWAESIRVPLLLLHGDADERVDPSHSIQLEARLKAAGRECELVIYPGGHHALLRFWDDVVSRCSDWMERHRI